MLGSERVGSRVSRRVAITTLAGAIAFAGCTAGSDAADDAPSVLASSAEVESTVLPTTPPGTETAVAPTSTSSVDSTPSTTSTTDMAERSESRADLTGRVIVLDPGHNGGNGSHASEINQLVDIGNQQKVCDTTGTATNDGYAESAFTWDVTSRLVEILESQGATVVLTREGNAGWGPCITERAGIGNRAGADVALSIHADGGPPSGSGFHVLYPASIPGLTDDIAAESDRLAYAIRDAYQTETGRQPANYLGSGGLMKRSDLGGLNLSDVPKVFIETGNMRNASDAAFLTSPEGQQQIAEALATGLASYLNG